MAASFNMMKLSSHNLIMKLSRLFLKPVATKAPLICRCNKPLRYSIISKYENYFLLTLIPVATVAAADLEADDDNDKPFEPNDVRLRSSECLKNAAGLAVDSTSAVLSQTVYAIIKVEKEYVELLNVLVTLLEYQMQVLGQTTEEQRIADIVLETRHEINKVKKRKQDLALLFASVEKLADATAEVAFATGSSYASTSAGERLYSAQQEVKRKLSESEKAEQDVAYAEVQMIEQVTRHEKIVAERSKPNDRLIATEGTASTSESEDLDSEEIGKTYDESDREVEDDNDGSWK